MTCGLHDGTLTRRLAEALLRATQSLMAERDLVMDSVCAPGTGEAEDPKDAALLADYDRQIDGYLELLGEAGMWPGIPVPIDESDPESLPDWSLALGTIKRLIRMGEVERGLAR